MSILIAGQPVIRVGQTWTRNRDHASFRIARTKLRDACLLNPTSGRRYWVANDTLRRTYTLTQEA